MRRAAEFAYVVPPTIPVGWTVADYTRARPARVPVLRRLFAAVRHA